MLQPQRAALKWWRNGPQLPPTAPLSPLFSLPGPRFRFGEIADLEIPTAGRSGKIVGICDLAAKRAAVT